MRHILIIGFILFTVQLFAQPSKNFIDQNYIEVQGKAEIELTPDVLYLNIRIDERDFKDKKSLEKKENELVSVIRAYDIDPETDLLINNMSSQFHKYLFRGNKVLKARSYQLKITDISVVSNLMIDLEKKDISNININKTEYSKIEDAKIELRVSAMKHSKDIANKMTAAIGQKIGKAIHVVDQYQYVDHYRYARAESAMMSRDAGMMNKQDIVETTPLNVRPIKLQTTVSVKYLLD